MDRDNRTSDYVCVPCGIQFLSEKQKEEGGVSTFSNGECGLCNQVTMITHMRIYNYLHKKEES